MFNLLILVLLCATNVTQELSTVKVYGNVRTKFHEAALDCNVMKCLHPIEVKIYREGVHVNPFINTQSRYRMMPCGKCVACRMRRAMEWGFRLEHEWKASDKNCWFITLTYAPEHLPKTNKLVKEHYQKFVKNFSMSMRRLCEMHGEPFKMRYLGVGEYGYEKHRPHYHFLLFNVPQCFCGDFKRLMQVEACFEECYWPFGFVDVEPVNHERIMYISKYVVKAEDYDGSPEQPFMTCSKRPFIGYQYISPKVIRYHRKTKSLVVRNESGYYLTLPRVYFSKIWNKFELWQLQADNLQRSLDELQQVQLDLLSEGKVDVNPYNGLTNSQVNDIEKRFKRKQYEKHMRRKNFRGIS